MRRLLLPSCLRAFVCDSRPTRRRETHTKARRHEDHGPIASPRLAALCAAATLLLAHADAAVFVRVPKTPVALFEELGGRTVQAGDVTVNGTPGRLTVFGFGQSAQSLCGAIAAALGRPSIGQAGAAGALLFAWPVGQGVPPQVLVISDGAGDRALALVIELPSDATTASPAWPWPDIAPVAGFQPGFTAEDTDARSTLVLGPTVLAPEVAQRDLSAQLVAEGWSTATPAAAGASSVLYARGQDILLATVLPPETADATGARIALLRKRPR